jgi:hypothetical protein
MDREPHSLLSPCIVKPSRRTERAQAVALIAAAASGGAVAALFAIGPAPPPIPLILPVPVPIAIPAARIEPAPEAEAMPMLHVLQDGGLRVVLASEIDKRWLAGAGQAEQDSGVTTVTRPLSELGRARFARHVGTTFRLHGAGGRSCLARLSGAYGLARFAGDGVEQDPADPEWAWETGAPGRLIAGDLEPVEGDCWGTTWARSASLPEPTHAKVSDAPSALRVLAIDQLRTLPEYPDLSFPDPQPGDSGFAVKRITTPEETLVLATLLVTGCSDLEPSLSALYRIELDGSFALLASDFIAGDILAAADSDGDGATEILFRPDVLDQAILRSTGRRYQVTSTARVPIFGCRC